VSASSLPADLEAQKARGKNTLLFRIYSGYRTLLSLVLLLMLFSPNTRQIVGLLSPNLYAGAALFYLATSLPLIGPLSTRLQQNQNLLFLIFIVDIAAIAVMADSSGGMSSGLPVLLVITSAASAVLIDNRAMATLVAAMAVLAVLTITVHLISIEILDISALFPAGLLGLLIFIVSLMVQTVAQRLGKAEALARSRASDLYNLQRLNQQIVQHMETGILLVNAGQGVRMMNEAASSLLLPGRPPVLEQGLRLSHYHTSLEEQYKHWQATGQQRAKPFAVAPGAPQVVANFQALQPSDAGESLVFIDDYTPITQQAQALKVDSLGRLTASIAHEIRNPLGAISHAAQLLRESPDLSDTDRRMSDIIVEHCKRVNQIVESVMQISRSEPPKPSNFALADWLTEFSRNYLSGIHTLAEVSIHCQYRDLRVEFDQENLARVLTNLLDNALRHSKLATAEECATIEVKPDFSASKVMINIIDRGEGVPESDQPKLFEPFFTTVESGSGMGLYLCKELCEINDADLIYRRTERGESCFRISLPQISNN
jgi:two-component system, NtrC family, sensor histidine kinase PilS